MQIYNHILGLQIFHKKTFLSVAYFLHVQYVYHRLQFIIPNVMWTCPNCHRNFKTINQSHTCRDEDAGKLFLDRPDELVLAYAD